MRGLNVSGWVVATDPGISPNPDGLPGLTQLREIVGALLTWGLVACVAGLVISAIVWAIGSNSGNPHAAGRGKTGVLIAAAAAVIVGGANAIITFFANTGTSI